MSTIQLIRESCDNIDRPYEYQLVEKLEEFVKLAEEFGFEHGEGVDEARDILDSIYEDWARQQEAEIWAENAWLRAAENAGYDTDGIWR